MVVVDFGKSYSSRIPNSSRLVSIEDVNPASVPPKPESETRKSLDDILRVRDTSEHMITEATANEPKQKMSSLNAAKMENVPPSTSPAKHKQSSSSPEKKQVLGPLKEIPDLKHPALKKDSHHKAADHDEDHHSVRARSPSLLPEGAESNRKRSPHKSRPLWYTAEYVSRAKVTPQMTPAYKKLHPVEEFHFRRTGSKAPWNLTPLDLDGYEETLKAIAKKWREIIAAPPQELPGTVNLATFWSFPRMPVGKNNKVQVSQKEIDMDALYIETVTRNARLDLVPGAAAKKKRDTATPAVSPSKASTSRASPSKKSPSKTQSSGLKEQAVESNIRMNQVESPPAARNRSFGYDFSYMNRAAEETLNDSELVKGQGYVPINRVYEPEKPVEQKEWELPADSVACETLTGKVTRYLSKSRNIEASDDLTFLWNGTATSLSIKSGEQKISNLKFKSIQTVKYSPRDQGENFLVMSKDGIEFFFTTSIGLEAWARLKRCFYKVAEVIPGQISCDMSGDREFWAKKIGALESHQKEKLPNPPFPSGEVKVKSTFPTKPSVKASHTNPKPPPVVSTASSHIDTDSSESEESKTTKSIQVAEKVSPKKVSDPTMTGSSEADVEDSLELYYKTTKIAVHKNDMVVRLRTKEELLTGKCNKLDLFDGPWRILRFNVPKQIYKIQREDLADEEKKNKMLSTKVELNFPRAGSNVKTRWIELRRLLPVLDTSNISPSKIHAGSLVIAERPAFHKLVAVSAEDVNVEDNESTSTGTTNEEALGLVRLKTDLFVAVSEIQSKSLNSNVYEVEKLRAKRLRRFSVKDEIVTAKNLETDWEDSWVSRYVTNCSEKVTKDTVIVTEYLVHWAGWPNEDDTWEIGTNNIPSPFTKEYNEFTDPLRDVPEDMELDDPETLFKEEDQLGPPSKKRKGAKSSKSSKSSKKIRVSKSTGSRDSIGSMATEDDGSEDIVAAQEKLNLRKAIKASLEDIQQDIGVQSSDDEDEEKDEDDEEDDA